MSTSQVSTQHRGNRALGQPASIRQRSAPLGRAHFADAGIAMI